MYIVVTSSLGDEWIGYVGDFEGHHTTATFEPVVLGAHLDNNFNAKSTPSRASHPPPSTDNARDTAALACGKAIS